MATLAQLFKEIVDNSEKRELVPSLLTAAEYTSLKDQYKLLSEMEEMFGPKSQHIAAVYIDKKMREILSKIEKLES